MESRFFRDRSATPNLMPFIEFICDNMGENVQLDIVYIDASKAFQKVLNKALYVKHQNFGVWSCVPSRFGTRVENSTKRTVMNYI